MSQLIPTWKERAKTFVQALTDIAFPPVCVGCKKPGRLICEACYQDIYWLNESFCPFCLKENIQKPCCDVRPSIIFTAVSYIGPIPKAIHHLKYEGHFALAKPLAQIMLESWQDNWHLPTALIAMPLHKTREKKRTYNQSALLAQEIAQAWNIHHQTDGLFRVRKTTPQVGLNAKERSNNVTNAFWAKETVKDETILLIDDVFTTGATMQAAAQALLDAGAKEVYGFTLAKAMKLE